MELQIDCPFVNDSSHPMHFTPYPPQFNRHRILSSLKYMYQHRIKMSLVTIKIYQFYNCLIKLKKKISIRFILISRFEVTNSKIKICSHRFYMYVYTNVYGIIFTERCYCNFLWEIPLYHRI